MIRTAPATQQADSSHDDLRIRAVDRAFAARTADQSGQLAVFLDAHRAIQRASLEEMTDEEVQARLVPSRTTLLGLVKQATFLQVVWYQKAITGTPRTTPGQPDSVEDSSW